MPEIVVDGKVYVPKTGSSDIKIVVLQRGWVKVGRWSRNGDMCALDDAATIRVWGTTKGLGELVNGPTSSTKLDTCGHVEFHVLTTVLIMDVEEAKWASSLR